MGPEGANVIFDTWVHPLVMGLEEHLLTMFREDFEFSDAMVQAITLLINQKPLKKKLHMKTLQSKWILPCDLDEDAEKELRKIPSLFGKG